MKHSELRDKIIQVSREVFSKYGFKKTSIELIAKTLKKQKTSIYYHFKSKEEIFQTVLEYEADILRRQIMEKLIKQKNATDKLKVYIVSRMKYIKELINFYQALKDDYFNNLSFIEQFRKKFDEEEIGIIRNILLEGVVTKEFTITRPDLAAVAIFTAMKGLEVPFMQQDDDLEDKINYLMDILFYGIKTIRN